MKQIRVIAENKSKLILAEDAQKGDFIDLADINSVPVWLKRLLRRGPIKYIRKN